MSDAASKIMGPFFQHHNILDSIADLIRWPYPQDRESGCRDILKMMKNERIYFENLKMRDNYDHSLALRNLRNAWYHESAFIQDIDLSNTQRMKYAAWKIIQFYYTIEDFELPLFSLFSSPPRLTF